MSILTVKNLLQDCCSNDLSKQVSAIIALQEINACEATPKLLELLMSDERNIRNLSAEALGYLGRKDIDVVGSALMHVVSDPDPLVRTSAIESLTMLDYRQAIELVKSLCINDSEWLVRIASIEALVAFSDIGDLGILDLLGKFIEDEKEDELIAAYAAWGMGILGTEATIPRLSSYLKLEESLKVKFNILLSRYRLGVKSDLDLLLVFLKDSDEEMIETILNHLQDLTQYRTPAFLVDDALHICDFLDKIGQSHPTQLNHIEKIISNLKELKIQKELLQ